MGRPPLRRPNQLGRIMNELTVIEFIEVLILVIV